MLMCHSMALAFPYAPLDCCDPCVPAQIPGPGGGGGTDGDDGADGQNAYTTVVEDFTMPNELSTVEVTVGSSAWMNLNEIICINGTYFQVVGLADATHVTLKNLRNAATGVYATNADPTANFNIGLGVTHGGLQGPAGAVAVGALLAANNFSDVANVATAVANLGLSGLSIAHGAGPPVIGTLGLLYVDDTALVLYVKSASTWYPVVGLEGFLLGGGVI